jgi:orotate phosphoribosyltransferase
MKQYKQDFIDLLFKKGAIDFGEAELYSKRKTPYFVDLGKIDDGESLSQLGLYYASSIADSLDQGDLNDFDVLFGPAYKGIPISSSTAIYLHEKFDINKRFAYNRKEPKDHGEEGVIVGRINDGDRILLLDDVMSTGRTKKDVKKLLNRLASGLTYSGLVVGVDRQEIGENGKNAVDEFTAETGIRVYSIVTATEILERLTETGDITPLNRQRFIDYIREFGTEEAKAGLV